MMTRCFLFFLAPALFCFTEFSVNAQESVDPKSSDPAVSLTKFAGSDLIKHPTGITVTRDGKLLAVESHTHFKPKGYEGNETDQIWWIEDSDGDGKADRRTLFFEADLVATMDIATHPDTGAIYVATRNEILRLWDKNGDGIADPETVERRLIFLDTKGNYPHNGCSGLTFDPNGNLYFGIGENLGAAYTLIGSDDTKFSDEGEGGNVWHCDSDGKKLRRVATGFWNPFGVVCSPKGHVFATDNDPSSRPPSRLHYVTEGGDYGYQFRYGRSGQHPFVSWNGELPGTLPMLHGSGEAPCDVIFHDGHLLVASWADHRIERYPLTWKKTHFITEQKILVQGGVDFRPVAFAKAQDGAIFVSDWVKRDYALHGEGAIWRMAGWKPEVRKMPKQETMVFTSSLQQKLKTSDPWKYSEAIGELQMTEELLGKTTFDEWSPGSGQNAFLLANQIADSSDPHGIAVNGLNSSNDITQLLSLKWISDYKLDKYRNEVEKFINDPPSAMLFHAAITALARIDDQPVHDKSIQRLVGTYLSDQKASPKVKRAAFQIVAERENFLSVKDLRNLFDEADDDFKIEVLLTLLVHPNMKQAAAFASEIVADNDVSQRVKFYALDVMPRDPKQPIPAIEFIAPASDIGRRAFHRSCAMCHRALGFGKLGGPDLSTIGERGREHIVKSITDPSSEIAPQYEPWKLSLADGTEKIGFLLGQKGGKHFYSDIAGNEFKIDNRTIVTREQLSISLMPPGLNNAMSKPDFEALVSWLESMK